MVLGGDRAVRGCTAARNGYDHRAMSTLTGQEPGAQRSAKKRRPQTSPRHVLLVVLAVLITLFAVFNLKEVRVDWIVGSGRAPLIIVIVISLLVGIVLAYFTERRTRRRR
jgi:uncharacterized integral membrane protein